MTHLLHVTFVDFAFKRRENYVTAENDYFNTFIELLQNFCSIRPLNSFFGRQFTVPSSKSSLRRPLAW